MVGLILVVALFIAAITYAVVFKDDFPVVLVERSLLFLVIFLCLLNIKVIIRCLLDAIKGVL